jgi:hypothetical protein
MNWERGRDFLKGVYLICHCERKYVSVAIHSTPHFSIIVIAKLFRCRGDLGKQRSCFFRVTLRVSWIATTPLAETPRNDAYV